MRHPRPRRTTEDGFTLVATLGVLLVVLLLTAAAYAEVDGDLLPQQQSDERRQTHAAAEAGVGDFLSRLLRDNSYWTKCADPDNPALSRPANLAPRGWGNVGGGSTAQFSVEVLPANGFAECNPSEPRSVLDDATGTFRIRSTGRPTPTSTVRRTVVTTFRPRGFLNYIYFTDFETRDPALSVLSTYDLPTRVSASNPLRYPEWAAANCANRYRAQRGARYEGQIRTPDGVWRGPWRQGCSVIQFADTDELRGPFHTNDDIVICGTPTFGRAPKDRIEVGGQGDGWAPNSGCSGARPDVNFPGAGPLRSDVGTWVRQAPRVGFPPSNAGLKNDAEVRLKGRATIAFDGADMVVTGTTEAGQALVDARMAIPRDGVVYVSNDPGAGACQGYQPWTTTVPQPACGDVFLSGTYGANVTIGAENDIVVTADVLRQNDAYMLGLVPNHWVRVNHPVTRTVRQRSDGSPYVTCTDEPGTQSEGIQIDAAILALQNSFVVDNYDCGAELGRLLVRGAIGQRYRGPVGTNASGYDKVYEYDVRLERRSPPRFINPVEPPWEIASQSEQIPATP